MQMVMRPSRQNCCSAYMGKKGRAFVRSDTKGESAEFSYQSVAAN